MYAYDLDDPRNWEDDRAEREQAAEFKARRDEYEAAMSEWDIDEDWSSIEAMVDAMFEDEETLVDEPVALAS